MADPTKEITVMAESNPAITMVKDPQLHRMEDSACTLLIHWAEQLAVEANCHRWEAATFLANWLDSQLTNAAKFHSMADALEKDDE